MIRRRMPIRLVIPILGALLLLALPNATASTRSGGELIAFERWVGDGDPDEEIWVMEPDGTHQRKLTDGNNLLWSPNGRTIAFRAESGRLSTIDADGTALRTLTLEGIDGRPSWSPDGKQLAYSVFHKGLFVVPASGGTPRQITHGKDGDPDWSPNGRKIVFDRYFFRPDENGDAIFVVNADGSGLHQLTSELGQRLPVWSPGGKKIAYLGWDEAAQVDGLRIMDADGSNRTLVVPNARDHEWSPRGGRVVFSMGYAIHTVRPDGRRHKRLARGRSHGPSWSADGRSIVFRRETKKQWDVYVMTASGKNVTNLTHTPKPFFEDVPAWSPAGG
jgi:Tol biopolymer transport system component